MLEQELSAQFPGRRAFVYGSGRMALLAILKSLNDQSPDRNEVLIGAYTCWSVAAAIVYAGLRIRLIDLDPADFDFDRSALEGADTSRALAIVTHHLFGLPNNMTVLKEFALDRGISLIDDAAQGFGARWKGSPVGGFGQSGVLSFGRGKGLTALGGGAALWPEAGPRYRNGMSESSARGVSRFARALAHEFFFSPGRYGIPARLPFLHLGETSYEHEILFESLDGYTASLARGLLPALPGRNRGRRERALRYDELTSPIAGLGKPSVHKDAEPIYLRYPLLLPRPPKRAFWAEGGPLGISPLYPAPIHMIPGLPPAALVSNENLPGSEVIAERLVSLPTHPLVTSDDQERIVSFIRKEGGS